MTSNVTAAWGVFTQTFTQTSIINSTLSDIILPLIITIIIMLLITRDVKKWATIMLPTNLALMAIGLHIFIGIPILAGVLMVINEIGIKQGSNIINIAKATRRAATTTAKAPAYTAGRIMGMIRQPKHIKPTKPIIQELPITATNLPGSQQKKPKKPHKTTITYWDE